MKYYKHPSTTHYAECFAVISVPVKISLVRYTFLKMCGLLVTKAPDSYTIGEVHIKAQIINGSHPNSYRIDEMRKRYNLEGFMRVSNNWGNPDNKIKIITKG